MTVFMVKMLENDDPYDPITSSSICVPRALPIECQACRVMLDSYPALIAHWSHRQNMDEARGRLVPEEFVDPRNTESYDDDRLTLDQDGIDRMVHEDPGFDNADWHKLLSTVTLEKAREACNAFVLARFCCHGVDGHSSVVIIGGWQAFPPIVLFKHF
jgi:hypothetical protein